MTNDESVAISLHCHRKFCPTLHWRYCHRAV